LAKIGAEWALEDEFPTLLVGSSIPSLLECSVPEPQQTLKEFLIEKYSVNLHV
jgi:hypothetical protein